MSLKLSWDRHTKRTPPSKQAKVSSSGSGHQNSVSLPFNCRPACWQLAAQAKAAPVVVMSGNVMIGKQSAKELCEIQGKDEKYQFETLFAFSSPIPTPS
jgi:hypothetical protein